MRLPNHLMIFMPIYAGALAVSTGVNMQTKDVAIYESVFWTMQKQGYPNMSYFLLNGLHEN